LKLIIVFNISTMTDEIKNKFHFDKIFKLSKTKVKEELPNEWLFLCKEDKKIKERMCICQRKIHHVFIYINKITGSLITVGSSCKKNLHLNYPKIDRYLHEFLNNDPGEYGAIESALEFSEDLRGEVVYYFEKNLSENYNIEILETISNKLIEIIGIYIKKNINAEILISLLEKYKNKIKRERVFKQEHAERLEKLRKEREEKERLEAMRLEREIKRIEEEERLEALRIQKKKLEKERLEAEKIERELQLQLRWKEERRIAKEKRIQEEELMKRLEAERLEEERIKEEYILKLDQERYTKYLQEQEEIKRKKEEERKKILSEWPEYFTN